MKVISRILGYVAVERSTLIKAAICMVVLSVATAIYAGLTGPAAKFLVSGNTDGLSKIFSFWPALAQIDRHQALWILPGALVAVSLIKGAAYFGQFYLMGMMGQRVVCALRRDFFTSLLRQDAAFFSSAQTGDLLSRFSVDIAHVERAVTYAIASCIRDLLEVIALLALAFWLDWRMSLVAFIGVPVIAVPISRLAKKLKRRARQSQQSLGRLTALVQEGLWGMRVIQAYGMENRELRRFDCENSQVLRAEIKSAKARSLGPAISELASVMGMAMVLYLVAQSVVSGVVQPERLVSFLSTLFLLYQPAKSLGRVGQFTMQAIAGGERLLAVIDRAPALCSPTDGQALAPLNDRVVFREVNFAYRDRQVLKDCSLELRKGEVLALVGESGAGKSTAALLAMRFADPQRGAVCLDDRDLRQSTLHSVRRQYGLVMQESLLFSGTVEENIAFGRKGATRQEVEWAAKVADAHDFIGSLSEGYQTQIGERGVKLSGGQKQRISLARALCAQAPVLLLDEATSNLDTESEQEVTRALAQALQESTALVIAHRLSTVRNAHRIAVLKDGRVVEEGSHQALLARNGEYARLYQREREEKKNQ